MDRRVYVCYSGTSITGCGSHLPIEATLWVPMYIQWNLSIVDTLGT